MDLLIFSIMTEDGIQILSEADQEILTDIEPESTGSASAIGDPHVVTFAGTKYTL